MTVLFRKERGTMRGMVEGYATSPPARVSGWEYPSTTWQGRI